MLIEPSQLLLFVMAGMLLNLTPGPDVLYIVSNALREGRKAGLVAVAGITCGCLVHVAIAALGLGVLLATSSVLFTAVKWIGAAYLLWVGIGLLRSAGNKPLAEAAAEHAQMQDASRSLWKIFAGGFLTNALNPKVALFFLAFLPQFIAPTVHNKALAFALLGVVFAVNSIPVNAAYALLADRMRRSHWAAQGMRWLDRVAGVLFIGFAARLALTARPTP